VSQRRVAVTGIGVITAFGCGKEALWSGIERGVSPIRRITRFDASGLASQVAAEVDGFDPAEWIAPKQVRRFDRFSQFAVAAAAMALKDACLSTTPLDPTRSGAYVGSALGGVAFGEEQHERYDRLGLRAVTPLLALAVFNAAAASNIAQQFDLRGPVLSNGNSCAAGAIAIGEAARLVARGEADVMLAGGSEAPLATLTFGAFTLVRAMSTRNDDPATACRPFDRDRDGFVMGEGAAILVLEPLEDARRRNARVYGEIAGFGTTNDAYHMTEPRPGGSEATRAIELALANAGMRPDDIGYVNAHASSTRLNDVTEAQALHRALGQHASRVPASGTKAFTGHPLGATGAIEAALCLLALERNVLPPTINLRRRDPEVELCLFTEPLRRRIDTALSNSFGFGGSNAALIFRRA
jgi:3-oxoacyl-[acyl-carrier-protein] synthase II